MPPVFFREGSNLNEKNLLPFQKGLDVKNIQIGSHESVTIVKIGAKNQSCVARTLN